MGHDLNECPHGTHVAKWPQGIQANRFSSSRQSTQGLDSSGLFGESSASIPVAVGCNVPWSPNSGDDDCVVAVGMECW